MPEPTGTKQAFDDGQRGVNAADEKRTLPLGEMFHRLLKRHGMVR